MSETENETKNESQIEYILEVGPKLWLAKVDINVLREQDLNARTMTKSMFDQLVRNIANREALESLPYCAETERGIEIVSGHHRVRGARAAKLQEIYVLIDRSGLTSDQIKSKQLAHNAIQGMDDPQLLIRIFGQISDVNSQIEAFIDPEIVQAEADSRQLVDIDPQIEFSHVAMYFLPTQKEDFDGIIKRLGQDIEAVYVTGEYDFDKFKASVERIKGIHDIRSLGTALSKMVEMSNKYMDEHPPDVTSPDTVASEEEEEPREPSEDG